MNENEIAQKTEFVWRRLNEGFSEWAVGLPVFFAFLVLGLIFFFSGDNRQWAMAKMALVFSWCPAVWRTRVLWILGGATALGFLVVLPVLFVLLRFSELWLVGAYLVLGVVLIVPFVLLILFRPRNLVATGCVTAACLLYVPLALMFKPVFSWGVVLVPLLAVALVYVGMMYVKDARTIHWAWASFLGFLRCAVYAILALVFLLPGQNFTTELEKHPKVLFLFDVSGSMGWIDEFPDVKTVPLNSIVTAAKPAPLQAEAQARLEGEVDRLKQLPRPLLVLKKGNDLVLMGGEPEYLAAKKLKLDSVEVVHLLPSRQDKIIQFLSAGDKGKTFLDKVMEKSPVTAYRFGSRLDDLDLAHFKAKRAWTGREWQRWLKPDQPLLLEDREKLVTAAGQRRKALLLDGSVLFVNQNSEVHEEGPGKLKLLHGEIFLELKGKKEISIKTPFLDVWAPSQEKSDTDTQFAVKAEKGESGVLVAQGMVEVRSAIQVKGLDKEDKDKLMDLGKQDLKIREQLVLAPEPSGKTARVSRSELAPTDVLKILDWTREMTAQAETLVVGTDVGGSALQLSSLEKNSYVQAIVIFSDGQSNLGSDEAVKAFIDFAGNIHRPVPVFTVAVGNYRQATSIRIDDLQAPDTARPDDKFPVRVRVIGSGLRDEDFDVWLDAQRVEEANGKPIPNPEKHTLGPLKGKFKGQGDYPKDEVTFEIDLQEIKKEDLSKVDPKDPKAKEAFLEGVWQFTARVPRHERETYARVEHISEPIRVPVLQKKLRILLFAGGPMRDYQFARTLFYREVQEKRLEMSVYLQTGAQENVDQDVEGERLLKEFPDRLGVDDPKEPFRSLSNYDVVIAFDADWTALNAQQQQTLEKWVNRDAGSIIFVAGPVHTFHLARPGGVDISTITPLLPVVLKDSRLHGLVHDSSRPYVLHFPNQPKKIELDEKKQPKEKSPLVYPFLQLDEEDKTDPVSGWDSFFWGNGPRPEPGKERDFKPQRGFYHYYPVDRTKPTTHVIATFAGPESSRLRDGKEQPFFAKMQYGAGQTFYIGSPETWRLRHHKETYHERFWIKLARFAASGAAAQKKYGQILLGRSEKVGQISFEAQVKGDNLLPLPRDQKPEVKVKRLDAPAKLETFALKAKHTEGEWGGWFEGSHRIKDPGEYEFRIDIPGTGEFLSHRLTVRRPNPELDNVRENYLNLFELASDADMILKFMDEKDMKEFKGLLQPPPGIPSESVGKPRLFLRLNDAAAIPRCLTEVPPRRDPIFTKLVDLWDLGYSGIVTSIAITDGGSDYTEPPTVIFSGGGGKDAAAKAEIADGKVTRILLTNRGSGYKEPPTITFAGGGGSGAAATSNILTMNSYHLFILATLAMGLLVLAIMVFLAWEEAKTLMENRPLKIGYYVALGIGVALGLFGTRQLFHSGYPTDFLEGLPAVLGGYLIDILGGFLLGLASACLYMSVVLLVNKKSYAPFITVAVAAFLLVSIWIFDTYFLGDLVWPELPLGMSYVLGIIVTLLGIEWLTRKLLKLA